MAGLRLSLLCFPAVSSPAKVSEFTRAAMSPGEGKREAKHTKTVSWAVSWAPEEQRDGISEENVSYLPLPQLSPKRLTAL